MVLKRAWPWHVTSQESVCLGTSAELDAIGFCIFFSAANSMRSGALRLTATPVDRRRHWSLGYGFVFECMYGVEDSGA